MIKVYNILSFYFHIYIVGFVTLTFTVSYGLFYIAEFSAIKVSGVISLVGYGLVLSSEESLRSDKEHLLGHFWRMLSYISTTLICILSGTIIFKHSFISKSLKLRDWMYLLLLYVIINITRGIIVLILYPLLKHLGYGINLKECVVIIWSGCRGGINLVLALVVSTEQNIPNDVKDYIMFYIGGIVFLTILINGTTIEYIVKLLCLRKDSVCQVHLFDEVGDKLFHHLKHVMHEIKVSPFLSSTDWRIVWKYIPDFTSD